MGNGRPAAPPDSRIDWPGMRTQHRKGAGIGGEITAILARRYPAFVYGGALSPAEQEVPVFVFHEIDGKDFESKLQYLKENGYETIDSETYYRWVTGKESIHERPRRNRQQPRRAIHSSFQQP